MSRCFPQCFKIRLVSGSYGCAPNDACPNGGKNIEGLIYEIFLPGLYPSLNEIIQQNRTVTIHRSKRTGQLYRHYAGAEQKKDWTAVVASLAKGSGKVPERPYVWHFHWVRKDYRTDPDNTAAAVKFVLDGLQAAGVIRRDGHKQVGLISHSYSKDKDRTGVHVRVFTMEAYIAWLTKLNSKR